MSSKTYICRCEDVTLEQVQKLLDEGACTMEEIKRLSRCTMGPCQGRTCRDLLTWEIVKKRGMSVEEMDVPTYRPPLKPIKLGAIAAGKENA